MGEARDVFDEEDEGREACEHVDVARRHITGAIGWHVRKASRGRCPPDVGDNAQTVVPPLVRHRRHLYMRALTRGFAVASQPTLSRQHFVSLLRRIARLATKRIFPIRADSCCAVRQARGVLFMV